MAVIDAILLNAGAGTRYAAKQGGNGSLPKQFQNIEGKPVFIHALEALLALGCLRHIVIVCPNEFLKLAEELALKAALGKSDTQLTFIGGGRRRQDSTRFGMTAIEALSPPERVLIHDACRPYLSLSFRSRLLQKLQDTSYLAWVPGVSVTETIKRVENNEVVETVDRNSMVRVQTPQIFDFVMLRSLMEHTAGTRLYTDDASLCEEFGIPVGVFEGDERNIKLTYEMDQESLRGFLSAQEKEQDTCVSESDTTSTV